MTAQTAKPRRSSKFREIGLEYEFADPAAPAVRFDSKPQVHLFRDRQDSAASTPSGERPGPLQQSEGDSSLFSRNSSLMFRLATVALVVASLIPFLRLGSTSAVSLQGVEGGPVPRHAGRDDGGLILSRQDDTSTDVCFRWAQQSALVNGTLYLYGGQASTEQGQDQNTWNNNFLTLDLTRTWNIAEPSLTRLPSPSGSSGPPAVALGYLWNSHESLFLYGGQFSWKPAESPTAFSTWEYSIADEKWIEHQNPKTTTGESAPSDNEDVQRASEGAGVNVPSLGRGFYFGGHLDGYTTQGWSQSIARVYLQSLLEFTFPGYSNNEVKSLSDGKTAGEDGSYRNITEGGIQDKSGFTQRADGLLIYIPGFSDEGILLALAGGSNETFTQMNNIDVYDIASSKWYKQATSGPMPKIRVNPCAVTAAAPDGSSTQIYMFGGQNLIPAGDQTQYDDMWILSVPSFTWIQVDTDSQSVPYGRSGHTCNVWNSQMVVVGGYVGNELSCESPGIYVFDLSNLEWVQQYTALSAGNPDSDNANSNSDNPTDSSFNSTSANNPFNRQTAQINDNSNSGGLQGSYGYRVPEAVIKVIGGDRNGGATITAPVVTATAGPLATGKAVTYTVTSDGATATETTGSTGGTNGNSSGSSSGKSGPNIAAIVAGVIAGVLFILVCYLLFCTFVYRKQLGLYKQHVEMSQRQARGEKVPAIVGLLSSQEGTSKTSSERRSDGVAGSKAPSRPYTESGVASGSGGSGYASERRGSSTEDLLAGQEPTFVGVLLNPRRSLRVVNKD